jgi:hypothetical protein
MKTKKASKTQTATETLTLALREDPAPPTPQPPAQDKITDAPSITIAPRRIGQKIVLAVELRTFKQNSAYPCGSIESAIKLAHNFLKGICA